jgi:hypothetical protein
MRVHVVIGTCRMREAAQRLLEAVWCDLCVTEVRLCRRYER